MSEDRRATMSAVEVEMARQIVEREEYILLALLGEAQKLSEQY